MFRVFLLWANVRLKVGRGPKDDAIESLEFGEKTAASLFESEVVYEEDRRKEKKRKREAKYQDPEKNGKSPRVPKNGGNDLKVERSPLPNILIADKRKVLALVLARMSLKKGISKFRGHLDLLTSLVHSLHPLWETLRWRRCL